MGYWDTDFWVGDSPWDFMGEINDLIYDELNFQYKLIENADWVDIIEVAYRLDFLYRFYKAFDKLTPTGENIVILYKKYHLLYEKYWDNFQKKATEQDKNSWGVKFEVLYNKSKKLYKSLSK